jgi:predicted RNase H-like HicB family nuclease
LAFRVDAGVGCGSSVADTILPEFVYVKNKPSTGGSEMKQLKIVVEKHPDIYVAYPLGLKGVVIGQGDSYEAALEDVKSAIQFHLETFGPDALEVDPPILEAFVAETRVAV